MTSDDTEPLQPLDPEQDPLANKKPVSPEQTDETTSEEDELETFDLIEPDPVLLPPKRESNFADPFQEDAEPLPDFEPEAIQVTPEEADTFSEIGEFELDATEELEEPELEKLPPKKRPVKPKPKKSANKTSGQSNSDTDAPHEETSSAPKPTPQSISQFCKQTCANGEQVAGKMRTLFRLPEPKPDADSSRSKIMGFLRPVIHYLFGMLYWIYSHLDDAANYYRRNRKGIWYYILDVLKHVPPTDIYQREIRIHQQEGSELKLFKGDSWKVPLSARCIHCGNRHDCEVQQSTDWVEDYRRVWFGFLIGFIVSIFTSIMTWNMWWFFGAPFIGLLAGYLCRKPVKVQLEYWTCSDHEKQTEYPQLRLFNEELFILVGHKNVRKDYIKELEESGVVKRR